MSLPACFDSKLKVFFIPNYLRSNKMLTRKRWRIGIGHICKMGSIQWWFQLPTHSKRDSTSLNKTLLKSDSTSESGKHGRDWEGAATESDAARHGTQRPTRLPTRWCHVWAFFLSLDLRRTGLIQPESSHIGPYRPTTETAEIGLESGRNSRNSHLRGIVMCFLPSPFFVLWIKDSNMFFNNILIIKIYRKYK